MTQTLKPDRPIWPTVPDTAPPEQIVRPEAPAPEIDPALIERPQAEGARASLSGFEGFGSFSG